MRIILDMAHDAVGHLSGTVRAAGSEHARTFFGAMDLLASIEELCDYSAPDAAAWSADPAATGPLASDATTGFDANGSGDGK
jgi:hypothetical protein